MASEHEVAKAIAGANDYTTKASVSGEMFQGDRRIGGVSLTVETDPTCYVDAAAHRCVELKAMAAFIGALAEAGWEMSQQANQLAKQLKH